MMKANIQKNRQKKTIKDWRGATEEEWRASHKLNKGKGSLVLKDFWILMHKDYYSKSNPRYYHLSIESYTNRTPANKLTAQIIDFLNFLPACYATRVNTMGVYRDDKKSYTNVGGATRTVGTGAYTPSGSTKGAADISSTVFGKRVEIEIKIGADRQSPDQKRFQKFIESSYGVYYIARDFQEFYQWFIQLYADLKQQSNGIRHSS